MFNLKKLYYYKSIVLFNKLSSRYPNGKGISM